MGQDATATLSEIEAARHRLEQDIDELDRRARPEHDLPEQAQRLAVAAGAGGVGLALAVGLVRRRLRARREHRHVHLQAEALADILEQRRLVGGGVAGLDGDLSRDARTGAVMLAAATALGALVARVVSRR